MSFRSRRRREADDAYWARKRRLLRRAIWGDVLVTDQPSPIPDNVVLINDAWTSELGPSETQMITGRVIGGGLWGSGPRLILNQAGGFWGIDGSVGSGGLR